MSIVKKREIGGTTGEYALEVYAAGGSANPFVFKGTVTTATDATHFASTDLIGHGNDALKDWYIYVFYDTAGTDAAPQGEQQPITDYVSSTGTFTHTAFTADLAVGDEVFIMHPHEATGGDATEAKQDIIIADTEKIYDVALGVSPTDGALASFIATGGTALGSRLPASKSLYDVIALDRLDNATYGLSALDTDLGTIISNQTVGIKKGVQRTIVFKMVDATDFATPETGITVVEEISKDGGAFAACTNTFAEIGSGWYKIVLTATEMNANEIIFKGTDAGCAQCDRLIVTES